MKLQKVKSREQFEDYYKSNNLNTIEEKIQHLYAETGLIFMRGENGSTEGQLSALEDYVLHIWDKKSRYAEFLAKKEKWTGDDAKKYMTLKYEEIQNILNDMQNVIAYHKEENYINSYGYKLNLMFSDILELITETTTKISGNVFSLTDKLEEGMDGIMEKYFVQKQVEKMEKQFIHDFCSRQQSTPPEIAQAFKDIETPYLPEIAQAFKDIEIPYLKGFPDFED